MRLIVRLLGLSLLVLAPSIWAQGAPPKFSSNITVTIPSTAVPKSNADWTKSDVFSELKKRGDSMPSTDPKTFGISATYPKGLPLRSSAFPSKLSSPFAAELPPDKDPTCKRTKCTQTCTTDKDGNQTCTSSTCDYTCS